MAEPTDIRQMIVMRTDLGMRKGKMIVQGAHASMKVLLDLMVRNATSIALEPTSEMRRWIDGLFTKICVRVDSEEELLQVYEAARAAGLPTALIEDAGLTEFKVPTNTCCAIGPARKAQLDPITGHLKLL